MKKESCKILIKLQKEGKTNYRTKKQGDVIGFSFYFINIFMFGFGCFNF